VLVQCWWCYGVTGGMVAQFGWTKCWPAKRHLAAASRKRKRLNCIVGCPVSWLAGPSSYIYAVNCIHNDDDRPQAAPERERERGRLHTSEHTRQTPIKTRRHKGDAAMILGQLFSPPHSILLARPAAWWAPSASPLAFLPAGLGRFSWFCLRASSGDKQKRD